MNKISKTNTDDFYSKDEEGNKSYKITTIGADNSSNLLLHGKVKTDGSFYKIEKQFIINKQAKYKTIISGYWFRKKEEKILTLG